VTEGGAGLGVAEAGMTEGGAGLETTEGGMTARDATTSPGMGEGGAPAGAAEPQAENVARLVANNMRFPAILININLQT
jgi:hypothetical protein